MGGTLSGGQTQGYTDIKRAIEEAQKKLPGYYEQAQSYLQPYQQAGVGALESYQKGLSRMADPQAFYQQMMSGYETSPQAKFQQKQAIRAANQAAAAGGMLGGGAEQKSLADYAQQLTARDQQQWLQNMTGIFGQYLGGEKGISQMGYGAGEEMGGEDIDLGKNLASLLLKKGMAEYGEDVSKYGWISDLLKELGMGTGFGLTGGFGGAKNALAAGKV